MRYISCRRYTCSKFSMKQKKNPFKSVEKKKAEKNIFFIRIYVNLYIIYRNSLASKAGFSIKFFQWLPNLAIVAPSITR